ncbi:uncharacterized protein LOC144637659 [Oculina patagonica]
MIRFQVTIDVPEEEVGRVRAVMSARMPQNWEFVRHRRVSQRPNSGTVSENRDSNQVTPCAQAPLAAAAVVPVTTANEAQQSDAWADSVLGGLEDHPPCPHCLMGPCITVSEITRIQGSCGPDITNHSKRHKNYRRFWKSLKDRGLWSHELYIERKNLGRP